MKNKLEEILFYEALNLQQGNRDIQLKILKVYNDLDNETLEKFHLLQRELKQIWNYINGSKTSNQKVLYVESISDYNIKVQPISNELLKLSDLCGVTLKNQPTDKFNEIYKRLFGKEFT